MSTANQLETPSLRGLTVIRPRQGLLDLDLRALWNYRELLAFLVWRELKVRYAQAALGAGWAILQPLFAVAIFTAVFSYFARVPSDGFPYPVFAFSAMLPWMYFAEAARKSTVGLMGDAQLVSKIYFPRLLIPFANVLAPVADFLITLCVLLLMMLWYGIYPSWNILLLPVLLILTIGLALSIGLWLGPVNVRFHDIAHTVPFLFQVWMYATPIAYPLSLVPERWKLLYSMNPMVGIIEAFRWSILGTGSLNVTALCISAGITIVALAGGLIFFCKAERTFADII
ncbi:MAG: ABC transporter permease [Burkholderiales bacterium]|nr:ABC transporter permease [Burkholderiales bacterium]